MSKIFERLMEKQIKPFANTFLNPLICGFREGHSALHVLLRFVENCKKTLDNRMSTAAIFVLDKTLSFKSQVTFLYKRA